MHGVDKGTYRKSYLAILVHRGVEDALIRAQSGFCFPQEVEHKRALKYGACATTNRFEPRIQRQ